RMDELGLYDDEGQLIAPQPVSVEDEYMLLGDLEGDLMQERNDEVAELLNGARHGVEISKQQLEEKIKRLETELRREKDLVKKRTQERDQANGEIERTKQAINEKERKIDATIARQREARAALSAAFRGYNLNEARRQRAEQDTDTLRVAISTGSRLHPDYECMEDDCGGGRRLEDMFPKERMKMERAGKVVFKSLRQLAALIDMREEWADLSIQRANTLMKERVDLRQISTRSMKKAYEEGICEHAIEESNSVDRVGVLITGEESAISEAISSALVRKGGRSSRRPLVVMVPSDSVVAKCEGNTMEIELAIYEDLQDLRRQMRGMETSGNFPKSLFLLIKNSFTRESIEEVKAYFGEVTTDAELTCYVSADMLPARQVDFKTEIIKMHQELLTLWNTEGLPVNLVVINSASGVLWGAHPFVTLFPFARRERKELFERAVKYIVDGTSFPMEEATGRETVKRSAPTEWGGTPSTSRTPASKKPSQAMQCYNCYEYGHTAGYCRKPKKGGSGR
ncbi:hypothetical protein PRIPAC_93659, partial [Pristionchus pacificus]